MMRDRSIATLLAATGFLVCCSGAEAQTTMTSWAGYILLSNDLKHANPPTTFSETGASWIEPVVSCQPNAEVSFWVGFDGGGDGSSTVEQAGTFVTCNAEGKPLHQAFWEMYSNAKTGSMPFEVSPGDTIEAGVLYKGNGSYTVAVADPSKHKSFSLPETCANNPPCKSGTAEWIVEAPDSGHYPLANYGTVFFNNVSNTYAGPGPTEQDVRMVPKNSKQTLTVCVAAPRPPNPRETYAHRPIDLYNSFQCQWVAAHG
jgi:Peptidase A4 family